jgi:DnaK suppressor protein
MPQTQVFLDEMKKHLEEEQVRLERELAEIGTKDAELKDRYDVTYPETGGNSDDDNAVEVSEYTDELSLKTRLENELRDTKSALRAMAKGKYGLCKYCGKEIDEKRLEARPASSSCIACKKVLTQEV